MNELDALFTAECGKGEVESLGIAALDHRGRLRLWAVAHGAPTWAGLPPALMVRLVTQPDAASVIVWHNHPAGDPAPSPQDDRFTRTLATTLRTFGITLADHRILGAASAFSFAGAGRL